MKNSKVAIVTDWLVTYAGAEKVIAEFIKLYPEADLYSVVDYLNDKDRLLFNNKNSKTTFIQKLPFASKKYQSYLPLMPLAIEQLDLSKYNLILSSSHAVAKGVITGPNQLHICYIHSPIRYAWDLQHQYLKNSGLDKGLKSLLARYFLHKIRMWDLRTVNSVDFFIANSEFIARRVKKLYGRDADVIHPPVDINKFPLKENKENYYLTASRLVPYKRVDLIVEAFSHMPDKKLVVIGDGSEMKKIKSLAGNNVEILGYQNNETLIRYMQNAKAFVFSAEEDFGIIPVEAMACGTPVVAYGQGGVLESVISVGKNNPTGIFFDEQNTQSIIKAIEDFENLKIKINPHDCRKRAEFFSIESFNSKIESYIDSKLEEFGNKNY